MECIFNETDFKLVKEVESQKPKTVTMVFKALRTINGRQTAFKMAKPSSSVTTPSHFEQEIQRFIKRSSKFKHNLFR